MTKFEKFNVFMFRYSIIALVVSFILEFIFLVSVVISPKPWVVSLAVLTGIISVSWFLYTCIWEAVQEHRDRRRNNHEGN